MKVLSLNVKSECARWQRPPRGFTAAEIERIGEIAGEVIAKTQAMYPGTLAAWHGKCWGNGDKIAAACRKVGLAVDVVRIGYNTVFVWDVKELVKTSVVNAALAPFGLPSFDGDVTTRYDVTLLIRELARGFTYEQKVALIAARDTAFDKGAFMVVDKTME